LNYSQIGDIVHETYEFPNVRELTIQSYRPEGFFRGISKPGSLLKKASKKRNQEETLRVYSGLIEPNNI
jgi:hypothetical protein